MSTPGDGIAVTYVGHATALLELAGLRILTDPLLRTRLGPIRRVVPSPHPAMLDRLDAVLISHLHHDHLDLASLRTLPGEIRLIAPPGAGSLLRKAGHREVLELPRNRSVCLGAVGVRAVEAVHSGRRAPFGPRGEALGYVLTSPGRALYFAGDTDLFPGMASLHPHVDVALVPIWGWGPHLRGGHMGPARAAKAVQLIRPRYAIPIHWGTYWPFALGHYRKSRLTAPAAEFRNFVEELAPATSTIVLSPGDRWEMHEP